MLYTLNAQGIVLSNPSACGLNLAIADNQCPDGTTFYNPNQFAIDVNSAPGSQLGTDVFLSEVKLIIKHQWASDLEVRLRSPNGKEILLTDDVGGSVNNYGIPVRSICSNPLSLTVNACVEITDEIRANPPFTDQPYRPITSLLEFNDDSDPNGIWTLSICDDVEQDTGSLEFVELVFSPLSCLPITEVEIVEQDSNSILINWEPASDCAEVETYIEYGPPGFTPGIDETPGLNGTMVNVTCPPFLLSNLAPESNYEVYLRKKCAPGAFSLNSCPLPVQTGCLPPGPAVTEDFDEEINCSTRCERSCELSGLWSNTDEDQLDWIAYQGATPTQGTGPSADINGTGKYLYLESSGSTCAIGGEAILMSDCYELQKRGADTCHFSFHYYMSGFNIGTLAVEVTDDAGLNWTRVWERSGDQANRWIKTYLSFNQFADGSIIQVRIIASKGGTPQADIAIDEITFHGSNYLGKPDQFYYVDLDKDGFGDPTQFVATCLPNPPDGFVAVAGDCDDTNPAVNPDAPEVPCDNLDNNCNGIADDRNLPPPLVSNDTICSGETPLLIASPVSGKAIFWFTQPEGFDEEPFFGQFYSPALPPNNTGSPQVYYFYAEETDIFCFSETRAEAVVVVLPRPEGPLQLPVEICPGDTFDLAGLDLVDQNETGASLQFYSQYPLDETNEVVNTRISPSGPVTYFYKMTSPAGCTFEGSIPVSLRNRANLSFSSGPSFSLCEESGQEVSVLAQNAPAPFSYRWSNGSENDRIFIDAGIANTPADIYQVSVTDQNGCIAIDSFSVLTTTSIDSVNRIVQNVSTCNGEDGAIILEPLSGVAPFTYSWTSTNGSFGDTLVDSNNPVVLGQLSQGAYRVTITDGSTKGCTFRMPPAYINGPAAEVRSVNVQEVSCFDAQDGQIELGIRGNPTYSWSNGQNTRIINNLRGGYYTVTITEGSCETVVDSIFVPEPDSLKLFSQTSQPACFDTNDGSLAIEVFGGRPNYSYNWSQGSITPNINGLSAGNYTVTVSDDNNCLLVETINLGAPAPLNILQNSLENVTCNGLQNGSISISPDGGQAPYKYLWSNGQQTARVQQLAPGNYTLTLSDFNGCSTTRSFLITEPNPLSIDIAEVIQPSCVGDTSGSIQLMAAGGSPGYQFLWDNGSTGALRTNLGIGNYQAVAFDSNLCVSDTITIDLSAFSDLNFQVDQVDPTCNGRGDGQISIQAVGVQPFKYQWDTGDSTATVQNLTGGAYKLTLTDGAGCLTDTTIILSNANQPINALFNVIEPRCANTDDGLINVNILEAQNQPLAYQWNDGPLIRDRQNITAGTYQVTITDRIGCQLVSDTIFVEETLALNLELVSEGAIQCKGDTNGFLEVLVDGGIQPYQYNWVGSNSNTNAAYDLGAGNYQLFVLDANGCPANANYRIAEPAALEIDLEIEIGNICIGDSSNQFNVNVTGGQAPYEFQWSNGAVDSVVQNLVPGDYGVVVRDANQCRELIPSIKVREPGIPLQLDSFAVKDISCFGSRDGQMEVQVSGGTAPFTYVFSNASIIESDQSFINVPNLPADDDYKVTVFDAQGCVVASQTKVIQEPPFLSLRRDSIKNISCANQADGAIFMTPNGGTPPYAYVWLNERGDNVSSLQDLRFAFPGTYRAVVADANICLDTLGATTIVDNKTPVRITSLNIDNEKCEEDQTGAIQVTVEGGTPPYRFLWNNGTRSPQINNLSAGFYSLTITDDLRCRLVTDTLEVIASNSSITVIDSTLNVNCFGNNNGLIQVAISGGEAPYQLSWEKSGNIIAIDTNTLADLSPGSYSLRVIDSLNCAKEFSYEITQPAPLSLSFSTENPDSSVNNGSINTQVLGGTAPYLYKWNTGDTLAILDSLGLGEYQVSVTDANACTTEGAVQLIVSSLFQHPDLLAITLFPNPASQYAQLDWQLDIPVELNLSIYQANGQLVKQQWLPAQQQDRYTIDLSNYKQGQYLVALRNRQGQLLYSSWLIVL
ncbi:MAG: hypothetical protein Sapg2KO_17540 [Saprospiraceae bacterium]